MPDRCPRVSVLVPAHQEEATVGIAVRSILEQEMDDLEVVVVDDGSTDGTAERVAALGDARVRLLRHDTPRGVVAALNAALEVARAPLVARMDADDWSLPTRLARQVAVMDDDPACVVCGTGFYFLNYRDGDFRRVEPVTRDARLRRELRTHSPINVGSAMYRADALRAIGGFQATDGRAEGLTVLRRLEGSGSLANVASPEYVYILRGAANRSTTDRFRPRNAAFARLALASSDLPPWDRFRALGAAALWRGFHLLPRAVQAGIRRLVSRRRDLPLSAEELAELEEARAELARRAGQRAP